MAFPNSIDQSTPAAADSPGLGDDQIRALKLAVQDFLGITDATSYTAGGITYQTTGVIEAKNRWSLKEGAAIVSAAALTPGTDGNLFHITGTVGITSIASINGYGPIILVFDDIVTITHNATSLIMADGANYTTVAGNVLIFIHEGSGNWREIGGTHHEQNTAKVHGLPASVNVLGDRSASGEFIQRGTVATSSFGVVDRSVFLITAAVTFAVAFSTTPIVVPGGSDGGATDHWAGASVITTTGFTLNKFGVDSGVASGTIGWIALGT